MTVPDRCRPKRGQLFHHRHWIDPDWTGPAAEGPKAAMQVTALRGGAVYYAWRDRGIPMDGRRAVAKMTLTRWLLDYSQAARCVQAIAEGALAPHQPTDCHVAARRQGVGYVYGDGSAVWANGSSATEWQVMHHIDLLNLIGHDND